MSRLCLLMASLSLLTFVGVVCGDEKPGEPTAVISESPEFSVRLREDVVYGRVGDRELLLDVFLPEVDGPVPAVIVIHGGAWRSGNRKQLRGYADSLAKRGMACFAIDYRLADWVRLDILRAVIWRLCWARPGKRPKKIPKNWILVCRPSSPAVHRLSFG